MCSEWPTHLRLARTARTPHTLSTITIDIPALTGDVWRPDRRIVRRRPCLVVDGSRTTARSASVGSRRAFSPIDLAERVRTVTI